MTVYVDDMRMAATVGNVSGVWSHLLADDSRELISFAIRLGMRPAWLQNPGTPTEHFDLTEPKRALALRMGARAIAYGEEGAALVAAKRAGEVFDLDAWRTSRVERMRRGGGQLDLF